MINWAVRLKNKNFWLSFVPAALLLAQAAAALFGFELHCEGLSEKLLELVNALFAVLTLLGIVTDPTTKGVGDSALAMTYTEPKES